MRPRTSGGGHHDLAVETTGAQQGRVQDIGPVGGGDENDTFVGLEAVHFDQQLVERLFALVMAAAKACAALAAHGVYFVDKDETGGVLLALHEQIAHAGRAHAHEHFHKIRAGNGKERHPRLSGHGPRQQRLTGSGRAHEQHALGDAPAQAGELLGLTQKIHDLGQFLLGFVHARHVLERDLAGVLRDEPRLGAAKAHGLAAASLHLAHEEYPDADEQDHGEPGHEQRHPPGRVFFRLRQHLDLVLHQGGHEIRVVGGIGCKLLAVQSGADDFVSLNTHFDDFAMVHIVKKLSVARLGLGGLRLAEHVEKHDHDQRDDGP